MDTNEVAVEGVPAIRHCTLTCADGQPLAATWFAATTPPVATLVIAAAMGVPRQFYAPFARYLASKRIDVLTFDYRGIGDSQLVQRRGSRATLVEWGRFDVEAALRAAAVHRSNPVCLLGHSVGGQILGLAPASETLAAAVFVAASLPHWRLWPGTRKLALAAAWYALVPLLSIGPQVFPARRLGFSSVDIPSGVTRQWALWGRHRQYLFTPALGIDVSRYRRLVMPVRAYTFDDDPYCPEPAARALLAQFPGTEQEVVRVASAELGTGAIGHFGFFREQMREILWPRLTVWLRTRAAGAESAFARK